MKTIKSYAELQSAIIAKAKENPKHTPIAIGAIGTTATIGVASTLTTTSVINGVATTVGASVAAKAAVVAVGITATAAASYYVYNKLKQ